MRKNLFVIIVIMALSLAAHAQKTDKDNFAKNIETNRVYRVFANNETSIDMVKSRNDTINKVRGIGNNRGLLTGLGLAIAKSYGTALVQKTVNATSSLITMAVNLVTKNKRDREQWLKTANQQCHFQHKLSSDVFIDDFYYLPSTNGALDPLNMKFSGFGCKSTLRPTNMDPEKRPGQENQQAFDQKKDKDIQDIPNDEELLEFFITCKIRDDSVGLARIAKHSKFEIVVDQFVFDARHSCLPNDSFAKTKIKPFDFNGRKDFVFNLNVKVISSWVNEAIMLFDNQQIGEFNITVRIDSNDLSEDYIFVYDPNKHANKVSVTGESFMVPRSFTGTSKEPSWGTGQYRLEMTINENCAINEKWYQKERNNGATSKNMKPKWDNSKWKPEWKEMQSPMQKQAAWNMVWQSVTTAYIGKDWVQELVSPLTTAVCSQETVALGKLLDQASSSNNNDTSGSSVPPAASSAMPTSTPPSGRPMPDGK